MQASVSGWCPVHHLPFLRFYLSVTFLVITIIVIFQLLSWLIYYKFDFSFPDFSPVPTRGGDEEASEQPHGAWRLVGVKP